MAILEREVTKYIEEGKDDYKQVRDSLLPVFSLLSLSVTLKFSYISYLFFFIQQKEAELQEINVQLAEAEKQREKINKDMGNIRQDIDTQKVQTLSDHPLS